MQESPQQITGAPATLPYARRDFRPSAMKRAGLWSAVVVAGIAEGFLYLLQLPNNVQSGTVGTLIYDPTNRLIVHSLMAVLGLVVLILLGACIRYTWRCHRAASLDDR